MVTPVRGPQPSVAASATEAGLAGSPTALTGCTTDSPGSHLLFSHASSVQEAGTITVSVTGAVPVTEPVQFEAAGQVPTGVGMEVAIGSSPTAPLDASAGSSDGVP